jgi:ATP-binding protein involved in chromosome partitioning
MSMALLADGPVSWRHPGGAAADTQVWRGLMEANTLRELVADTDWGGLDVLIVDLPPGADRFEVAARVLPLDRVLAVTIPSAASVEVVVQACHAAAGLGQAVSGLAVNMAYHVCAACGHEEPLFPTGESPAAIADRAGTPLLATIPFDARVGEAGDSGVPIVLTDPDRPASRALAELANALIRPAMAAPGMPLVGPA